jgi:hypothetical protein
MVGMVDKDEMFLKTFENASSWNVMQTEFLVQELGIALRFPNVLPCWQPRDSFIPCLKLSIGAVLAVVINPGQRRTYVVANQIAPFP